ncbi:MAG: type II secretion system F family protein [Bacteroidota bacterium]|nr:type II secretion system F family protein [Bacteroidota bacterium]
MAEKPFISNQRRPIQRKPDNSTSSIFGNKSNKKPGSSQTAFRKKKVFRYSVRRGAKTIEGFQNAYSADEVKRNLVRLGFNVKYVRRHYEFQLHASSTEIVSFVTTSARLLEQKIPYSEVLQIMANNAKDRYLKGALRNIILDLKNGVDSKDAFIKQEKVFGEHVALMLGIASKSGEMTAIFKSVAILVERQTEFKKGLISSLIMPAITSLTVLGAIIFYAVYLVPKMMAMLGPMMETTPPLTAATMIFSEFLKENYVWMSILMVLGLGSFYAYLMTENGKLARDKYIIKIPYIGNILRSTSTEIFCRVLSILYTSSSENVDAIQIAADASGSSYLSYRIRMVTIPSMLRYGTDLGKALNAAEFFPDVFVSRFSTATETGAVKDTALQVADFYQLENQFSMKNLMSVIEISITIVIMAALVFLTLLSTETASLNIQPSM